MRMVVFVTAGACYALLVWYLPIEHLLLTSFLFFLDPLSISLSSSAFLFFPFAFSVFLKLLLGSIPDPPTPSGPPKFEASSKRAAQPTSWSQRLTRLRTRHLCPNSELNSSSKNCPNVWAFNTTMTSAEILKFGHVIVQYNTFQMTPESCDHNQNWWCTWSNKMVCHWDSFLTLY